MNQRYILLSSVLVAGSCMAQWAQHQPAMMDFRPATEQGAVHPAALPATGDARDGGDVVWSEDFANGFAGNNGVGAWTAEGPNGDIWKRAINGPNGAYTQPTQRIVSTTVANGYMLFASDSANSDWSVTPPVIIDPSINFDGSLVSPLLDLSATPYVELQFQQRLRYCCNSAPHYLEVSTDGGLTWPNRFPTSTGIAVNIDPGTQTRKINISAAIAADPTNVKFRFRHDPDAGTSHYHWQLDDVKIVEVYDYDLRVNSAANSTWDINTAMSYDSLRYSVYPYSQLRPLGLNMNVLNNGAADQTDVTANFHVQQGANVVLDQNVNVPNFPAGTTQTVYVTPDFTPPAVAGTYDVTYNINSAQTDNVPADNVGAPTEFQVSASSYGRDLGSVDSFEDGDGLGGTLILANAFYIANPVQLYSVDIALGTQSDVGTIIRGELRTDDLAADPIAVTPEIEITAADLNGMGGSNFLPLLFDSPVQLDAGTDYMISVQFYGYARCGNSGESEEQTSFIYYNSPTQGEDWFYTTTTPMIRMGFDPSAGIEAADRSNGIGLGQNFPNPSRNTTMVPYDLATTAPVSFEVRDVSGKVVMVRNEGTKAPGAYRLEISTESLTEGVYFYTMTAGTTRLTKRMTVIR
ncbi:MAG: T9SS type A sorting domain-containing protein [Flavobacteriales bacterium]